MKKAPSSSFAFRLGAIGLAVLGATAVTPALAQWSGYMPGYIGGNIGRTTTNDFDGAPLTTPPAALGLTREDDRATGGKIYGGWQVHPNFALEAGFFHLGSFDYGYAGPAGTLAGDSRYRGLNLDLVGRVPFGERFAAFARVGAAYTEARSNFTGTGALASGSRRERDWNAKYGLGLEYAFTPSLAVRAEWERYRVEDPVRRRGNVDMASIGLVYRFGAPAVTRVVAPAPAPAVTPPPPPPPRVETPPPPPPVAPPPPPAPAPAPLPTRPYRN